MARKPTPPKTYTLSEAVSMLYSGVQDLSSELQDWADNMPENMQDSDKHSAIEDAANELEVDEPDVPETGIDSVVSFKFGNPKYMSKVEKLSELDNFRCAVLDAALLLKDALEERGGSVDEIEDTEQLIDELEELENNLTVDWS